MDKVEHETLIALPATTGRLTTVRSTLIQSSLATLRKRGHFERYLQLIDPKHKAGLLETLAPEWLPVELGIAHYQACDSLGLSSAELHEIGEDVGHRIQGAFIATLVRNARTLGLTPWVPLGQFKRLRERLMEGGAVGLTKTGPKDAVVDLRNVQLCKFEYFRVAFCGVITSAIKLGAGKSVRVRVTSVSNFDQRCVFACSWV